MPEISQQSHVLRPADLPGIDRGRGARTTPLVTVGRGATAFINGRTEFGPGASIAHHTHNVPESVLLAQGAAIVDIDGVEHELSVGDVTFVPANVPHHFTNASDSEPAAIFWTYGSLDATRTKVPDGVRERIDVEQGSLGEEPMKLVREQVELHVAEGQDAPFISAVAQATTVFQGAEGCRSFHLEKSVDKPGHYRLIVQWETIEHHTEIFRSGDRFIRWRELVSPFLAEPPAAEHFVEVYTGF